RAPCDAAAQRAPPRDHLAPHAVHAEVHAHAVDAHDPVPVGLGEVHDVRPAGDAGVVHEHVDVTEGVDDAADHLVDGGDVADVGGEGEAAPAERADGAG